VDECVVNRQNLWQRK